jgi:hypothetical protein
MLSQFRLCVIYLGCWGVEEGVEVKEGVGLKAFVNVKK